MNDSEFRKAWDDMCGEGYVEHMLELSRESIARDETWGKFRILNGMEDTDDVIKYIKDLNKFGDEVWPIVRGLREL